MGVWLVFVPAILFLIAIFPVHVVNYVFASTAQRYASAQVTLYGKIKVANISTKKDERDEKDNKKQDKKSDGRPIKDVSLLRLYNNLCITKFIQLSDFGLQSDVSAQAAAALNALFGSAYAFIKINGGRTKVKSYTVFNYEHGDINYYLKLEGVVNFITLVKLTTVFILEKLNER